MDLTKALTSKERMLTAFRNEQPDRVPASPDISNMVPAKLTGKPFWEIYLYGNPPLWKAYIEAVKYYKIDGWQYGGYLGPLIDSDASQRPRDKKDKRRFRNIIMNKESDVITVRTYLRTPKGKLWSETNYYKDQPPWTTRKFFKDFEKEFEHLQYFYPDPSNLNDEAYATMAKAMGNLGTTGLSVGLPGFQDLYGLIDGGLPQICRLYMQKHYLIEEYRRMYHDYIISYVERGLKFQPEFLMIGASGLLTLQSPKIFLELSLPTLKKITRMAKEAGIPSHLHSCGREKFIVEKAVAETDLSSIEPLEPPPNGDCDLAEIKRLYGKKIALKGNIQTTKLLFASPKQVELMAKECIEAAKEGGGYVLSTGDQVGRDTPDENIFAIVKAAKKYGQY
ncbi:MAG: uroporphyrinogen decarboxylase family protein [Candidatus Bathyarchaeia archaeon]